jgi:ABC-type transport system involved in multi-copper enzyme maturation permease subunit
MVIENLQITPLAEWLLGAGWYNGWLWHWQGVAVLLTVLLCGGLALILALRRGGTPGSGISMWTGSILGALTLVILAGVIMCSTSVTRDALQTYVGKPVYSFLEPMLGKEISAEKQQPNNDDPTKKDEPAEVQKDWSSGAIYTWLGVITGLLGLIYFIAWLVSIMISGPAQGTRECGRAVLEIATDIARISPRRVFALAALAWRESFRRRVMVVFVVFVAIILFATLFLKKDSIHPSQLYITVVLNCTIVLIMIFALVVSALSLPGDIREKTLHTVVTKPVRKVEIVLGRVLGFTAVGTALLAAMGLLSYGFTVNSLRHTHKLTADMLHKETLPGNQGYLLVGETGEAHGHNHRVTISVDKDGKSTDWNVETRQDHTHELEEIVQKDGTKTYKLGSPIGQFQARVPIYGKLSFTDKSGAHKGQAKNINVGDEWTYRSFIQGRTNAMATWLFTDLHKSMFPEEEFSHGIPIEMTLEVFRTHKGNMEKGVAGTIFLENPKTHKRVTLENFSAEKFITDTHWIPLHFSRAGSDGKIEKYDLFNDIVSDDGQLAISIQCLEYGQNFGMAQADLYIRAADGTFEWNFVKAYFGIWLQMVLVLSIGVAFSTMVSGPVALLGTIFMMIAGVFSGFVVELSSGKMVGGGPFEAAQRIMTQDNMISPLDPGLKSSTLQALDQFNAMVMRFFSAVLPEFGECSYGRHLAFGFNVGPDLIGRCMIRELGFVLPVLLLGYLCLKQREVAQ